MARRSVVGDSVYEIRFLEMSHKDFATTTSAAEIMTDAEVVALFPNHILIVGCMENCL